MLLLLQVWGLRKTPRRRRWLWQRSSRKQRQSPLEGMTCLQLARGSRKGPDENSVRRLLDEVRPRTTACLAG